MAATSPKSGAISTPHDPAGFGTTFGGTSGGRAFLIERFEQTRRFTETLVAPLAPEDCVIQTMTETSPTKWHLAHTTWFFERFILQDHPPAPGSAPGSAPAPGSVPGSATRYTPFCEPYDYLFNSYYDTIGPQHCRPNRGLLSRPTVSEVYEYRRVIDERMTALIRDCDDATFDTIAPLVFLGTQHEQQHQELIATDIKHTLSTNPLLPAVFPARRADAPDAPDVTEGAAGALRWRAFDAGLHAIGRAVPAGLGDWAFDNESPEHRVFLEAFELASRPVTNGEYLRFIEDGGYKRSELWLSLGWATVNEQQWTHPIYWYRDASRDWHQYTLSGSHRLDLDEPVCHISYFEADAYARWAQCRLPTEFEWEAAAREQGSRLAGHFADSLELHPRRLDGSSADGGAFAQLFGDCWEWTSSSYAAYPGFQTLPGALGEYNGKFMCNQYVLRGGSCATPAGHFRVSYRNFFPPESRWQFAGLRLARQPQY